MSYFLWHTIVDTTANQLAIHDREEHDLYRGRHYWSYQLRNPQFNRDRGLWTALWPRSKMIEGDPTAGVIIGADISDGGVYEPLSFKEGGSARYYFIHGVCVDGSSNPLAGCTLYLYLTSTRAYVSSGQTDSNGIYSLGTPFTGQNHFVVANYGPNSLVGSSINTLQPVLSPW